MLPAEEFKRYLALERGLSRNTWLAYAGDVSAFMEYCASRGVKPEKADSKLIEEYLWKLRSERKLAAVSVFRKTAAIRVFYKFLRLENITDSDPTANFKAPKVPRRLPEFLSREQMEALLHPGTESSFSSVRTTAAIALLYATGIRVSELLGLRVESVNFQQGWLRVFGKGSKERMVPVNKTALDFLRKYLDFRAVKFSGKYAAGELFLNCSGNRLSRVQMWKDVKARGIAVGVKINPHPHLFRHTFASHMVQGGADLRSVQEMLGHKSLNTTQIYSHLDNISLKRAHDKYHPDKPDK